MKEEIRRVMKLVQDGVLSPEDAAELIDAMQGPDESTTEEHRSAADSQPSGSDAQSSGSSATANDEVKDTFKSLVDMVENLSKEVSQAVNWPEVSSKLREGASKGLDQLRQGVDKIKDGKFNFDFFMAHEVRDIELPIRVPAGRMVQIENPCGDVVIRGGDNPIVKAKARVRGTDSEDAKRRAAEYTVFIEESDHKVVVRQPDMGGLQVDLDIVLPPGTTVDVRTNNGDLSVDGTKGACKAQATSGDIVLKNLEGAVDVISQSGNVTLSDIQSPSLTLENRSGDVRIERIRGNINVRAASGDLHLAEITGKTISVESVSGDVLLDLSEPVSGNVSVRTVNGQSSVTIPDGSDCRVSISTLRGTVSCAVDLEDEARSDQHITGRIGDGTGSLDLSAVNGNIAMKLRNHVTT